MENNEMVVFEEIEDMNDFEVNEKPGIGTGVAMLIGAGLTLAVSAGVKLVKKGIAAYKAKKELRKLEENVTVDNHDYVDVATE